MEIVVIFIFHISKLIELNFKLPQNKRHKYAPNTFITFVVIYISVTIVYSFVFILFSMKATLFARSYILSSKPENGKINDKLQLGIQKRDG